MRGQITYISLVAACYVWAYTYNVLAAVSQLGNALLAGDRDMTFSCRTGLAHSRGRPWAKVARPLIDFVLGRNHCSESAEWAEVRETFSRIVIRMRARWLD